LDHFEALVEKLRIDVVAFGRHDSADAAESDGLSSQSRRAAEEAAYRAAGALALANPDDPAVRELRRFYDAVVPLIMPARVAG
jgi:hypothetical protein